MPGRQERSREDSAAEGDLPAQIPVNASDADFDVVSDYPRATVANYQAKVEDGERDHAVIVRGNIRA